MELFASIGVSQFHPNLKGRLEQSSKEFVKLYIKTWKTIDKILLELVKKKKLPANAPIFKTINNSIKVASTVKHEKPILNN